MTCFNRGYNAYCQGIEFSEYETRDWQRGWYAAQRDSYAWWYMQVDNEKEMALKVDKNHGQV